MAVVPGALSPEAFARQLDVSRETLDRLRSYEALLQRWQPAVNLVGRSTLADPWRRHFLDSGQLALLAPPGARVWVDLGSGAGFPGMVLAIMGVGEVHLVESDTRKATFLAEVARETGTAVAVHRLRAEALSGIAADVVTARALAPLADLLPLAARFAGPQTIGLFPKGREVEKELTAARKSSTLRAERLVSLSDPSGVILRVKGFGLA